MERRAVVPETTVSSVTPCLRAMMAAAERQSHRLKQDLWRRPRDPHWKLWSGYANSGRSPDEVSRHGNTDDLPSAEHKEQRQRKKQRRQSEEGRASRMNSTINNPRRGCLGDVNTGSTLPDDGLYTGRSRSVLGGVRGWGNPWKVNDATLQSLQKIVENYGKMMGSPARRWLRWRLHEVRSRVLCCFCREGQPCHGE